MAYFRPGNTIPDMVRAVAGLWLFEVDQEELE